MSVSPPRFSFMVIAGVAALLAGPRPSHAGKIKVYYDYVEDGQLKGGVVVFDEATAPASFVRGAPVTVDTWSVTTVVDNGPVTNRLDVVIVGDGYTDLDLPGYATDVANVIAGFFDDEPLDAYASYFNVHRVDVISNESGVDEPDSGIYRDTALDMRYDCDGIARLLCINVSKAWAAAN